MKDSFATTWLSNPDAPVHGFQPWLQSPAATAAVLCGGQPSFHDFLEHVWIYKLNSGDSLYVLNFASFWKSFEEDLSDL